MKGILHDAHITIATAINHAGDVPMPCRLMLIIHSDKERSTHSVGPLQTEEFLDEKNILRFRGAQCKIRNLSTTMCQNHRVEGYQKNNQPFP